MRVGVEVGCIVGRMPAGPSPRAANIRAVRCRLGDTVFDDEARKQVSMPVDREAALQRLVAGNDTWTVI